MKITAFWDVALRSLMQVITLMMEAVLSAYQEKIPARNARNVIYAHVQDFMAIDELLLAILKAFVLMSIPLRLPHSG
jgi:hypothetical protein